MVSRIDQSFECYKIIVDESKNKFSVTNIESLKGHILPGNVSYCLCHNEIILISYSNIEYQLYSFVGNKFTLFDNYTLDTSNLLFLELVYLSESEYGMVGLSESGVCTLSTQKRVVVVATIEQPHKISSLTVFREGKHIFCVVGCFDGSILVFKNGELLWENLFAHPNTVSRIECTKEVGANGSFFLSLSSFGGSLCGHSRNGEIIFCATQDSVILDFLVDASIGLIFTCTKKSVCAWRLSDGEVEQVFDIKTFSDLYMTGSYRSAEAALSICRHQLYNEVFFSFAISVDVLVSKLECARTVPNEFTVALTILLSSCAACEKENPFSNGFMHTIDRLGLSVPPIASEANFYFAILMESALFDYVDTSKEIVSICETTFNLHESLLQYCKSASIVPEFILLKYYQHFKHFKCRTYTLCRTFFSYIVNTLSSLEMIERFIQIFLNHKDAKCFDFVDFMGTQLDPKDFWGLLSTLSVVWKNTFENFSQVSHLWSLLHQVVDNVLTATVHSSSSKQDCVNTMISLSSSFWLDSGNVNKKKWLDTILEYSFDNNDQSCLHSLEYIASMDLYCFYEKYLFPLYHQKPQWRTALLSFQRRLIEKYQMESYYAPYPLLKIICSLFSTLSIFPKSEFSERIDENVSLIVASTKFLSNVAFHRQLQSLAIGLRDGCVSVLNIKTNDLASFVAHKAAVLCVAYNVHSSSSHDIATVCEQMHRIKIWRAKLNNGFISELFNSSTKNFTLVKSIDLPSPFGSLSTSPTTPNDQFSSRRELLNLNTPCFYRCSLKWVSSSTIKFVSPWSGALEFSV